jgi:lactoylglutathione lyase
MMPAPRLNLIVLRAIDPTVLVRLYTLFGCRFQRERHGTGPEHFSADLGGTILEIYPRSQATPSTAGVRLGFTVSDLRAVTAAIEGEHLATNCVFDLVPGRAVLIDLEGHRIELNQA